MQEWVKATGAKVVVVFEGRDAAGKGGVIHRIMERVSPRVFRHVALPAPTEREKSQMYAQRYIVHMPAAGEVILFDRSWYNRALVEHVMGFCTEKQYDDFIRMVARGSSLSSKTTALFSSSTGLRLARRSSTGASSSVLRIRCEHGSSAPWTWNRIVAGMTIREPETQCLPLLTRHSLRGTWSKPMTKRGLD